MTPAARDAVLAADAARLAAMTRGDLGTLATLLAHDLIYTHGSGRFDDRTGYLAALAGGGVRYIAAEASELSVHGDDTTAWLHGRLQMELERDGTVRRPDLRTLSIWRRDEQGRWTLAALTGTPISADQGRATPVAS